jgi:hypothetical protein
MGFRKAADGITKTGKTEGKNLGDSGLSVGIEGGAKGGKGGTSKGGKTDADMLSMGRGLAKVAAQKRG